MRTAALFLAIFLSVACGVAAAAEKPSGAPSITMQPLKDTSWYTFKHPLFPGAQWTFRVPEHMSYDKKTKTVDLPTTVVWETAPDGRKLSYRCGLPEERKKELGLDFWGSATAGSDTIDFELKVKNVGAEKWEKMQMTLFCLQSKDAPIFRDYDAVRTYIHRDGKWVTINEVESGKFAPHRMVIVSVRNPKSSGGVERLAAKVSEDGQYVLGLATDIAETLSFNFQNDVACIHSNPDWGLMDPGQEVTAKGKVYLFKGTLEDLWQRYCKDFGVKPN